MHVSRSIVAPPTVARPLRLATVRSIPRRVVYEAIREAEETCASASAAECAVAWDIVEELSAAAATSHASDDPLEDERVNGCEIDPADPECRMYDI